MFKGKWVRVNRSDRKKLKELVTHCGTLEEAAERLGILEFTLSKWMDGEAAFRKGARTKINALLKEPIDVDEEMIKLTFFTFGGTCEKPEYRTHEIKTWKPVALAIARQLFSMPSRCAISNDFIVMLSKKDRDFILDD